MGQDLPVLVLTGPTGAGKTDWALGLAESAPVEIVSVDSALVYRGLDIGTAKPARELRERVPHHLIDICEPTESYSAGRFVPDAVAAVRDVHACRRVPLLVGGTMLYLRSLLHGLAPLPQADSRLRAELDARRGLPAAVGAPRRAIPPGGGGAAGRCGDAPTGEAAADLDAWRGSRPMDRAASRAVVESRHM